MQLPMHPSVGVLSQCLRKVVLGNLIATVLYTSGKGHHLLYLTRVSAPVEILSLTKTSVVCVKTSIVAEVYATSHLLVTYPQTVGQLGTVGDPLHSSCQSQQAQQQK